MLIKGWILTKLVGYRGSMVLIICTKNESNLINRYWDMVPDGQTDGMDGQTDGRCQNYIPPTSSGDKYCPILWWPQKNIHKIYIPKKILILLKTPKNIEIQNFEPKKWTESTYIWKYQSTPPGVPSQQLWSWLDGHRDFFRVSQGPL